jgi:predicted amidohydrolase YtcJ
MKTLMTLLASATLLACHSTAEPTTTNSATVFINADLITMTDAPHLHDALAVRDGRIEFIGSSQQAQQRYQQDADIIDLEGLTIMPGIHDSHVHALEAGAEVGGNCWLEADNLAGLRQPLLDCRQHQVGTDWLTAYGHELHWFIEEDNPRQLLDQWISDRPVVIMEQSSHSAWVNSEALARLNYHADSHNPPGGIILRDKHGEPNGILLETAAEAAFDLAYQPTEESFDLYYDGLLWAMDEMARHGITSIADARVYWQRGWLDVWHQAELDGALKTRVNLGLWAYPLMADAAQIDFLKQQYRYDPKRLLQINQIKIYSDGIIHNTTAALKQPYQHSLPDVPTRGLNYFDQSRLAHYIAQLQPAGFDFHIHTIGDRGVHEALNAIASHPAPQQRHRLTHVEMVDDHDLPRFAQLGVIADMQVAGDFTLPHNHDWQRPYIGDRIDQAYRLKDLLDSQATVVLSSDWTVSSLNPFIGIHNAVNRGEQSIRVEQALAAYTRDAAFLMRSEERTGTLEVGKHADLIVIDQNPLTVAPQQLRDTRVLLTMMNGDITFQHDDF